eukprot:403337151
MTIQAIHVDETSNTLYLGGKHGDALLMGSYDLEVSHRLNWFNLFSAAVQNDVYQIISRKNQVNILVKSTNTDYKYMILALVDPFTGNILTSWQFSSTLDYDYFPGYRIIIDKSLNTYLIDSSDDTDIVKFSPYLGSFQQRFYDNLNAGGISFQSSAILYDDTKDQIFIASMSLFSQDYMIAQLNLNPISISRKQYPLLNPLGINDFVINQVLEFTDTEVLGCLMYNQDQGGGLIKNYVGYMRFNRATNSITKVVRESSGSLSATTYRRCAGINKMKNGQIRLFVTSKNMITLENGIGYYKIEDGIAQHQFFKYSTFENIDAQVMKAKYFKLKDGWFFSGQFILNSKQSGFVETIIDEYICFKLFTDQTLQGQQSFQDLITYTAISTTSVTYDTQNLNLIIQYLPFSGTSFYAHITQAIREAYPDTYYCDNYAGDISIFHTPSQKVADNVTIECVLFDKDVCSQVAQYKISECYDRFPLYFELRDYANNTNAYTTKKLFVPTYKLDISSVDFGKKVEIGQVYHVQVHAYVSIKGVQYRTNDFIDFYVTFTGCDDKVKFLQNMFIPSQQYFMGDGLKVFNMTPPIYSLPDCVQDIKYTFVSNKNIHNEFLDFKQKLYSFDLESKDINLVGKTISIDVTCKLTTLYNITSPKLIVGYRFAVSFLDPQLKNQAPYFSQKLQDQTCICTMTRTYILPSVLDKENDMYFIQSDVPPIVAQFAKFDYTTNVITITPQPQHEGKYLIKMKIIQVNNWSLFNDYSFTVTVVPYSDKMAEKFEKDQNKESAVANLKAKIQKISTAAIVTVVFEQEMDTPPSKSQLEILSNTLAIYLKSDYLGEIQLEFQLLSFKDDTLLLKLSFPFDRGLISQESQDEVEIVYVSEDSYYSKDFTHKIPLNYKISKAIIPQLSDEELDFLNQMAELMKWTLSSILGPSMVINLAMSQGLQSLWGMIKGLQLLTHLPLMNLNMPANLICFYSLINDIASFNLIPTDSFTDDLMEFDEDNDYALNNSFEFMGYQSVNSITNLGLLFYIILINLVIMILALFTSLILSATKYKQSSFSMYIKNKILFNQILRLQLEAQLELCLCSLLAVFNIQFNVSGEQISTVVAFISLIILLIQPFFAAIVVYIMKRDQKQNQSLSTIYEDYNLDSPLIVIFTFLSVGRRLIYTFVMIRLQYKPSFQIIAQMYLSILMLVLMFTIKPYKCQRQQRNEIINELAFLGTCYTFIPYSSAYKLESKFKFMIGWFQIGIVLLYVTISVAAILVSSIKNMIISIKTCKLKRRIAQYLAKIQSQKKKAKINSENGMKYNVTDSINDLNNNLSNTTLHNESTLNLTSTQKFLQNEKIYQKNLIGNQTGSKPYTLNSNNNRMNQIYKNQKVSMSQQKNLNFMPKKNSPVDLNISVDPLQNDNCSYWFDQPNNDIQLKTKSQTNGNNNFKNFRLNSQF